MSIDWRVQPDGSEHGYLGDAFLFKLEWCDARECWSLDHISGEMDYGIRDILYDYDGLGAAELRRCAVALLRGSGVIAWDDPRSTHYKYINRVGGYFLRAKNESDDGVPTIHRQEAPE